MMKDKKKVKLKDCPFCESKEVEFGSLVIGICCYVACNCCGANGATCKTAKEAAKAWNRRAKPKVVRRTKKRKVKNNLNIKRKK